MLTPTFQATIQSGKLLLDDKHRFLNYLTGLDGKRVEVKVEREKRRRSNNQNSYYWGVVLKLITDHTGAEPEDIHAALKMHFCPKRFIGNLVAPSSTARLDTVDFEAYLEKVRRWAAEELSINIPDPNQVAI
jgi:hypothetical protein